MAADPRKDIRVSWKSHDAPVGGKWCASASDHPWTAAIRQWYLSIIMRLQPKRT